MFYNRGEVISDQFDHLTMIQRLSTIVALMLSQKKYGIIWEFFPKGGGGVPYSQNFVNLPSNVWHP